MLNSLLKHRIVEYFDTTLNFLFRVHVSHAYSTCTISTLYHIGYCSV